MVSVPMDRLAIGGVDDDSARKPYADTDLRVLFAAIARRDTAALERFYDLTVPRCYGLALQITNDAVLAEQAIEELYAALWTGGTGAPPPDADVDAWLAARCRSVALERCPRRAGADIDASFARVDPSHPLYAQLARLSAEERHVLALAFFRGLAAEDIAACLGIGVTAARTALRSATGKLQRAAPTR